MRYPNVHIGKNVIIEDNVVIGYPPNGKAVGECKTIIGDNCHLRSGAIIYAGNIIGDGFVTGHYALVREFHTIGNDVKIGSYADLEGYSEIGNGVRIHSGVQVGDYTTIKDDVWIGPRTVLTNVWHPKCEKAKDCMRGCVIHNGAIIGARVVVMPRVCIGQYSVIGAGSVVVKDVDANIVVVGNPARYIKDVNQLTCPYSLVERPYNV